VNRAPQRHFTGAETPGSGTSNIFSPDYIRAVPTINPTDDELAAVAAAIRRAPARPVIDAATLGSVGYENSTNEKGKRLIWLDRAVVDRLRAMRGPGESYSDVIMRVAGEAA
jgi:hypothetical protein